jgi:rhodanese-related sulfurtransferase
MKKNIVLSELRNFVNETKDDWNYITPVDYYNKYHGKTNHVLIDIRDRDSYNKFHIKNAINIYWLDLLNDENLIKLQNVPKDKPIFLICYLGHTSSQALVWLKLLGFKNVVSIKFGYGKSPVFGVPVAGWLSFNLPTEPKCDF